jgi:hypothetical protein
MYSIYIGLVCQQSGQGIIMLVDAEAWVYAVTCKFFRVALRLRVGQQQQWPVCKQLPMSYCCVWQWD